MRTMVKKLLARLPSLSVWLYENFSTETFLVTWNYVPLAWPRRAGEGIDFHWLQHNPNDCVGFGVYPARILFWHKRWPLFRRCRAEDAAGWAVFGLKRNGRECVLSLYGSHRLAEQAADILAHYGHRRRIRSKRRRRR